MRKTHLSVFFIENIRASLFDDGPEYSRTSFGKMANTMAHEYNIVFYGVSTKILIGICIGLLVSLLAGFTSYAIWVRLLNKQ